MNLKKISGLSCTKLVLSVRTWWTCMVPLCYPLRQGPPPPPLGRGRRGPPTPQGVGWIMRGGGEGRGWGHLGQIVGWRHFNQNAAGLPPPHPPLPSNHPPPQSPPPTSDWFLYFYTGWWGDRRILLYRVAMLHVSMFTRDYVFRQRKFSSVGRSVFSLIHNIVFEFARANKSCPTLPGQRTTVHIILYLLLFKVLLYSISTYYVNVHQ